jgi:hypothetical protein
LRKGQSFRSVKLIHGQSEHCGVHSCHTELCNAPQRRSTRTRVAIDGNQKVPVGRGSTDAARE